MTSKKLNKGFYISSILNSEIIYINPNEDVVIFDNDNTIKQIILLENSKLRYFSDFNKEEEYNKHILLEWENSKCELNSFIFSKSNKVKVTILWEVISSNSEIDMKILSFIWEKWFIDLDWVVKIWKNLKKVKWFLKENNVFLSSTWKIKWIPKLFVASNDVEASHSCSIEKVKDDDIFYLRSRWIEKEKAVNMILRDYLSSNFHSLWSINNKFCSQVIKSIFNKI